MDYLYFLQNLREAVPQWINEGVLSVSELAGGTFGLVVIALIYWCFSKKAGMLLMMSFSFSQVANTIVKNILCVPRPFNRDSRLVPFVPVTGYSFPSGHTMISTAFYGSIAVWQKKRKAIAVLCLLMILFVAFSRNWLGAHTIQDVVVGMLLSGAIIAMNSFLLNWVEKHPEKDWLIAAAAWGFTVVFALLFPTGIKYAGLYLGVMTGWILERRVVRFTVPTSVLRRAVGFVSGIAVVALCYKVILPAVLSFAPADWVSAINYFFTFLLVSAGWPAVIGAAEKKWPEKKKAAEN